MHLSNEAEPALLDLLATLERIGYEFVPVTPATHARVVARPDKRQARNVRDVFGWSLPFAPAVLPSEMLEPLDKAGLVQAEDGLLKSRIRIGSLHDRLIVHSAYPTIEDDAVFFSPDTLRFADFVRDELLRAANVKRLVDIGAGAGSGALSAAAVLPGARLTLCDINPLALRIARINARHSGLDVETVEGGLEAVRGGFDAAIANPPFMVDEDGRTYRDGGEMHGGRVSVDWAVAAATRLSPGGRLILYTGSAIVEGRDQLRATLEREMAALGCSLRYRELDPDIYGEELERCSYADVERIAAVGAVIERPC
ncbi:MAG: class I SAM-dependent methyltransferase [Pseudomonadota bacterium]|nr:class I SAM-dependent methyltransferase [Pseudomonadota bacterium]